MGFLFHCRRVAMWTNCLKWAVSRRGVTFWTVCWAFWRRGTPPWITCPPSVNSHLTCIASICMYRREEECWRYAALIYQNFIIPLLAHCGCLNYLPFHYLINSSFEHRNICILKMLISWISRRDGSFVFLSCNSCLDVTYRLPKQRNGKKSVVSSILAARRVLLSHSRRTISNTSFTMSASLNGEGWTLGPSWPVWRPSWPRNASPRKAGHPLRVRRKKVWDISYFLVCGCCWC